MSVDCAGDIRFTRVGTSYVSHLRGMTLTIECLGQGNTGWVLTVQLAGGQTTAYLADASSTCTPLYLLYTGVQLDCGVVTITLGYCPSSSSSGSPSPSPSPTTSSSPSPSAIPCQVCIGPTPTIVNLPLSGFTGDYAVLNGDWILSQTETPCVLSGTLGESVATMVFLNGDVIVIFGTIVGGQLLSILQYNVSFTGDCCAPIFLFSPVEVPTLSGTYPSSILAIPDCVGTSSQQPSQPSLPSQQSQTPPVECGFCPGTTPQTITLNPTGFTGCLVELNGPKTFTTYLAQPCKYVFESPTAVGIISFSNNLVIVALSDLVNGGTAVYSAPTAGDCCNARNLTPQAALCFGGGATGALPVIPMTTDCDNSSLRSSSSSSSSRSPGIVTACCGDVPRVLTAIFTQADAEIGFDCDCLLGASCEITWDPDTQTWEGTMTCCGGAIDFSIACSNGVDGPLGFDMSYGVQGGVTGGGFATAGSCSPFEITFQSIGSSIGFIGIGGCLTTNWTLVIF